MEKIYVKDLMLSLEEYATVSQEATLQEAILALEKAQMAFDPSLHKHRAILVLDEKRKVVGKISMKDILIALEPNYGKVEGMEVLSRSGYSPDLIKSMFENNTLWREPLEFVCERSTQLNVNDFMQTPSEGEYIDESATLSKAIHRLIVSPYLSLLVTRDNEVVGILRLSDVFSQICEKIKTCEL